MRATPLVQKPAAFPRPRDGAGAARASAPAVARPVSIARSLNQAGFTGWADGFAFTSFGVRIGIRVDQPGFSGLLQSVLPPGHRPTSPSVLERLYSLVLGGFTLEDGGEDPYLLYDGAERLARDHELPRILKVLEAHIRRTVAEMAPRRVFVHAGVIEHGGRAIVIPGPSMSGKSTLVSELIKLGASYYSDEYAVLDEKGMVSPFAKPLSLRAPGTYASTDYTVEQFGATAGVKPVPVGLVAITHYAAGAKWRPRRLSAGNGALALLAHSIAARRHPERVLSTLNRALADAEIVKGPRGEASEVAHQMLEVLHRTSGITSERARLPFETLYRRGK